LFDNDWLIDGDVSVREMVPEIAFRQAVVSRETA
jgi:hypothetical protein